MFLQVLFSFFNFVIHFLQFLLGKLQLIALRVVYILFQFGAASQTICTGSDLQLMKYFLRYTIYF